ncbi:hypothetical protein [Sphingomonas sp. Leaf339]|uniref:hypothetical protein n=1 Tax=Sphingomonas sp. Leaf339 TaxID=1736343 RepID=UPI0012E3715D|nr:hypothetical protein [Sphingomonas sp. Leaf339]
MMARRGPIQSTEQFDHVGGQISGCIGVEQRTTNRGIVARASDELLAAVSFDHKAC